MSGRHIHGGHAHASGTLRGGTGEGSDARALRLALGLIVGFVVLEVVAVFDGRVAGAAGRPRPHAHRRRRTRHGAGAIRLAVRPATATSSFGLKRAEIFAQHEIGAH